MYLLVVAEIIGHWTIMSFFNVFGEPVHTEVHLAWLVGRQVGRPYGGFHSHGDTNSWRDTNPVDDDWGTSIFGHPNVSQ